MLARTTQTINVRQNSAGGNSLTAVTGTQFEGVIGTLTMQATPYQVGIEWGDGTHSMAAFTPIGNSQFVVRGAHTYAEPGTYRVTVIGNAGHRPLFPLPGQLLPEAADFPGDMEVFYSTATVTGSPVQVPPPAVQGTGLSGLGAWSGDVPFLDVAEFRGLPQDPELPSLYATIDWGDGTGAQQNLVFVTFKDGAYVVSGSHEYRATTPSGSQTSIGGTFPIKVTLYFNDHDDATKNTLLATAQTSIDVMPNSPGGLTLNLAAGAPFSGVLGTFTADAARSVNAGFIDWGDGSTQGTDATLTPLGNNVYQVSGSHTYAAPGRYRISLQLDYGTPEQFDTTVFDALVSTASIT